MSDPITLSAEAWAAISCIALPLTAALASNLKLTHAVNQLKAEMSKIATHEGRLLKLENFAARSTAARRQRK